MSPSQHTQMISIGGSMLILGLVLTRLLHFYTASDEQLITVIPDDAFYYLQMATHRLNDGFWSFDGVAVSTGFHLLYGYFLYFLQLIFGPINWRELFLIVGLCSSLLLASACYCITKCVGSLLGPAAALFALAPFLTTANLIQSTAMMESWLVIFFSALTLYSALQARMPSRTQIAILIGIGLLGSLARSDFGLLPGMLTLTFVLGQRALTNHVVRSVSLLLGSCIGVALSLLHNILTAGHLFQASAQTKLLWSSLLGHNIDNAIQMALFAATPSYFYFDKFWKIAGVIVLGICLWRSYNKKGETAPPPKLRSVLLPGLACTATIAGYIVFYRFNSQSLQYWYIANFLAPSAIVLATLGYLLFRTRLFIPGAILCGVYLLASIPNIFLMQSPDQVQMLQAGKYLANPPKAESAIHPGTTSKIGAWNAGIMSYFSGKQLINLDGLANDEIYPYIQKNDLLGYLRERQIGYVIDYMSMLSSLPMQQRGGYLGESFEKCLIPLKKFTNNVGALEKSPIVLYQVEDSCLQ